MNKNRNSLFGSLTFLFGLIFGGFLTLLLSTDDKGETKKSVKSRVKEVKLTLKEVSEKEKIQAIFGEVSSEATRIYTKATDMLSARLAELKETIDTVDKEKYKTTVQQVMEDLKKEGAVTAQQLKKLTQYLANDYKAVTKKTSTKDSDAA